MTWLGNRLTSGQKIGVFSLLYAQFYSRLGSWAGGNKVIAGAPLSPGSHRALGEEHMSLVIVLGLPFL